MTGCRTQAGGAKIQTRSCATIEQQERTEKEWPSSKRSQERKPGLPLASTLAGRTDLARLRSKWLPERVLRTMQTAFVKEQKREQESLPLA